MIKNFKIKIVSIFFIVFFMFVGALQCGANNLNDWRTVLDEGAGPSGAGYRSDIKSPEPIIATVIKALLSLLGIIFLILMIYGGILWMTARGNTEQVTKAKDLIIAAIIGLIIVLVSYAVSYFVIKALTGATLSF